MRTSLLQAGCLRSQVPTLSLFPSAFCLSLFPCLPWFPPLPRSPWSAPAQSKKWRNHIPSATLSRTVMWYYFDSRNGETRGPFTTEEMQRFFSSGALPPEIPVFREGFADWTPANTLSEFSSVPISTAEVKSLQQATASSPPSDTPSDPLADQEGLCPICGYFAGALLTCPRCGARTQNRISVRLIKKISVIGSILGVLALWFAAQAKSPATVSIGDIDEPMNGAFVRIVGRVTEIKKNPDKNSLRLRIDDGTGILSVSAFNKLKQIEKILGDDFPGVGDKVEVIGTINETQRFGVSMFLSVPERLKLLEKLKISDVAIGDLSKEMLGEIVRLRVSVAKYIKKKTRRGSYIHILTFEDGTGSIGRAIGERTWSKLPPKITDALSTEGTSLEFEARIGEYRGRLQAEIVDFDKIKILGAGGIPHASSSENRGTKSVSRKSPSDQETRQAGEQHKEPVEIPRKKFSELDKKDIGKLVSIEAEVRFVDEKGENVLLTLDDGTGRLRVMVWKDLQPRLVGFENVEKGTKVSGTFLVSEYRGRLQLKIRDPEVIRFQTP
ncbi:MAG: DUF4339 domain-containing protein [Candidatus Hydrogenedentota bacterium]|nr:MAG: DUF4339 domain-containing protein [Candidatus Hydrogenedentota bacterium]